MRGLPGSGKSSLAHELNKNGEVLSTDDYFYDKFNNYNYNPNILSEAHNWNKDRTRLKMFNSVSPIFIDNTNLQVWEFEPYVKLGLINNYHIEILEPETPWKYNCKELSIRCIHGVPQKKIEDMKERFHTNVSISYIIKNIKSSNALPFNFKKPETMSHANEDEPDVIIESSSSEEDVSSMGLDSITSVKSSEGKLNSNDDVLDNDMSGEEFLQMVDQFGNLLRKNIKKQDQGFEENTHKSESNEPISEDEAMYKFCSDMEDKFGVPVSLLSLEKDGEENSSKTLNNCLDLKVSKTVVTDDKSSNDIEEWDCVSVPVASWDSEDKKSPDENNKSMTSKLPRIKKREENSLKLIDDYYHNSDEEKEDPSISSWVPEESSLNSWIMETANNSIPPPKFAHTGAIPKISKSSQNFTSPTENIREVKHSLTTTPLLETEKSTQYCTSDYSCNNNFLKLLDCNSVSFIPAMPRNIENNSPLTKLKLLIDKSTMTSDLSSIVADSHCALKKLISFFPDIPSIDLHDVLEKCSYDLDWAMNLLIDGGYKLADPIDHEQFSDNEIENEYTKDLSVNTETFINEKNVSVEHPNSTLEAKSLKISNKRKFVRCNNLKIKNDIENCFFPPKNLDVKLPRPMKTEYDNQNLNKLENANKEDGPSQSKLDSGSESEDGIKKSSHYLTMELDPSFASRLINIFGPISSLNLSSGFTKADQTVILPLELCHQIHKYWGKTLEGKFQHEENVLDRCIKEDEELARRLQEEEDAKVNCDAFDIDPPKSFQEIVDLEKALNQSNTLAKSSNDNTCSSILTLQKLQEEFSHVDSDAVEQEFFEQGHDYNSTKSLLSYKYGKSKSVPKVVLAPGMTSEQTDEETKSFDSEEDNWEEDTSIDVLDPQVN
ncbi:UNVERIFIED_CONTAM: hypothetical protein GTU68_020551 [Idotea baltica]|nr:hypothetical protein [Idotea baltica]